MADPGPVFRFKHPVEVRFRDLDPMGHAHHSLALVYFEEARAAYWREVVHRSGLDGISYILASSAVRYHARMLFPQTLEAYARVSRLGEKSWAMEYELRSATGDLLASGESVQVMYDYGTGESIPIPPGIRDLIQRYEQI